jgi:hypothetical protein
MAENGKTQATTSTEDECQICHGRGEGCDELVCRGFDSD